MRTTKRLRDDCGGARFLDLRGLTVLGSLALVSSVLSNAPSNLSTTWRWTLVNLAALLVTAVPVIIAHSALKARHDRPVALGVTVTVGAAIGATKGVATSVLGAAWDLLDNPGADLVGRTVNTAFVGALVIPAMAALLAAHDRWKAERETLLVELVRRALDDGDVNHTPYRQHLASVVTHARHHLPHLEADDAAAEMRRLVDHDLRPLSSEVLAAATTVPPVSSGWQLVRMGVTSEPWAVRVVTVLFAISTWLLLNRHTDSVDALARTLVMMAALVTLLTVGNVIRRRWPSASFAVLVGILVTVAVGQRPLGDFSVGELPSMDNHGITIASSLWLAQLLVASAAITAARHERDVIRSQLLDLLGPQGVRDAIAHGLRAVDGREFAFFVHGHVQNQLIAAAQRLETTRDPAVVESTKRSVVELLERAHRLGPHQAPLGQRLLEVTAQWDGIAQITLNTPVDLDLTPPATADRIAHVLTEAITNSVRHGAAQRIDIDVTRHGSTIEIVVTDDGFGPRRGRPGTGSRYLDLVAPHSWTLTAAPQGGACLTLRMPDETH